MRNIRHDKRLPLSSYRKIAIGYWRRPVDPSTYSTLELDVGPARVFMAEHSGDTPITLTHFVAKILGNCFEKYPGLNMVLLRSSLYQRTEINIFVTTLLRQKKGKDLSGFTLPRINTMTLPEVADMCHRRTEELRQNRDPDTVKLQQRLGCLPSFVLRPFFAFVDLIQYEMNISPRWLGSPRDPFGSAIVTNIGAMGIDNGLVPLSPYSRCPLIVGIGKPREVPVVKDGDVTAGQRVTISFTVDHRYADGVHGARMLRRFRKLFERPKGFPGAFGARNEKSGQDEEHPAED